MKQLSILISGFTLALLFGCGSSDNSEAKVETPAVKTDTSSQPVTSVVNPTAPAATATVVPTTNTIPVTTQPVTTTTTTAAGLNPAHGQPGHRCDISVGAPLNSAPRATTTPTVNTSTTAPATLTPSIVNTSPKVVTTPTTTAQPVAAGMNPAHGQPGHRCDIAVGAPLNSPVKPMATPVKQ